MEWLICLNKKEERQTRKIVSYSCHDRFFWVTYAMYCQTIDFSIYYPVFEEYQLHFFNLNLKLGDHILTYV
jgi:hypothetical protein